MLVFARALLATCACAALAASSKKLIFDLDDEAQLVQLFNDFKQEYKKNYRQSEHSKRYQIFVENLAEINAMNERDPTATYGINEFTDMTTKEFEATKTGYVRHPGFVKTAVVNATTEVPDIEIPKQFDWRDHNVVTSVKDQGDCASCWAFSTVGNIEGQYAMKHKEFMDFSPQQLVSCETLGFSCIGGDQEYAMKYLVAVGGLETEQAYPYTSGRNSERGICNFDKKKIKVTLDSYKAYAFSKMSEDQIAQLLVATGPLSISLAGKNMKAYTGGILSNENCQDSKITHAVLLVGYGEENGVPYWLIKNSWGIETGEKGYFRIQRDINCLNFKEDPAVTAVLK